MAAMLPLMTLPSCVDCVSKLASSMAAKSSREGVAMDSWVAARAMKAPVQQCRCQPWLAADFPADACPQGGWVVSRYRPGLLRDIEAGSPSTPGLRFERLLDLGLDQGEGGANAASISKCVV